MNVVCYNKATNVFNGETGNQRGIGERMCSYVFKSRYHLPRADWSLQGHMGGQGLQLTTLISFPSPPTTITVAHKSIFDELQRVCHS